MHRENAMSAGSDVVVFFHRPNYIVVMQRLQAFKYELRPDGQQERQMRRFAGSCRFVFNKALALQKTRHEQGEKKLSAFELNNLLPQWKAEPETKWLSDSPSQTLQQALKDLDRAYKNFFAKDRQILCLSVQEL